MVATGGKIFVSAEITHQWQYVLYCRNCGELWIADHLSKTIGPAFCQLCLYKPSDGTFPYTDMPEPQNSVVLAAFKLAGWDGVEGLGMPELMISDEDHNSVKWKPALDGDGPAPGTFPYGASCGCVPPK